MSSPIFTVHHGKTYIAKLKLSWFESFAGDEMIADKFRELGFKNVIITGSGEHRWAQGLWNGPDESVPLTDEHIESVKEVDLKMMEKFGGGIGGGPLPPNEENSGGGG